MSTARRPEEEILLWCGIIAQLARTRSSTIIGTVPAGAAKLPYPLFVLLRHFCHNPARQWTVTQLTAAFETTQSGMTKQVQKLLNLGYLEAHPDPQDARVRWLTVTAAGVALRDQLVALLEPDQQSVFADWSVADKQELHRLLGHLKRRLDEHRDDVLVPNLP